MSTTLLALADESFAQAEATDFVTVLESSGPRLAKKWLGNGDIQATDRAKWFRVHEHRLSGPLALSNLLKEIESDPRRCIIRGKLRSDWRERLEDIRLQEKAKGEWTAPPPGDHWVLRRAELFEDAPHHWMLGDEDKFEPSAADPIEDPETAIDEFILKQLGEAFAGVSYHWQLSSSAGHASTAGKLKAHLWFWLAEKRNSAEMRAWATVHKVLDTSVYNVVHLHYTAAPVFEQGVSDPVRKRSGYVSGLVEDTVTLTLTPEVRAAAATVPSKSGKQLKDPREKPGLIGKFHRAFTVEQVVENWLSDQFEWVTDDRLTWLGGNGAAEGAFVREDRQGIGANHNTWPWGANTSANLWDLVRHFKFGHLDTDPVEVAAAKVANNPALLPSYRAMVEMVKALPEVQREEGQGAPLPTVAQVAEKLRAMRPDEILACWLNDTVRMGKGDAHAVIEEVSRLTGRGVRVLAAGLTDARAGAAKQRKEHRLERGANGRMLVQYAPANSTGQARQVEAEIVRTARPGDYVSFGGLLAHVVHKPLPGTHRVDDEGAEAPSVPQIEPLGRASVLEQVQRVAVFHDMREGGPEAIGVPQGIIEFLIDKKDHAAPEVSGLVTHPIVLSEGRILAEDGLHGTTGLFLTGAALPDVRSYTQAEARDALQRIAKAFLDGFEFASNLDAQVAIAGLFTGVQRRLLDSAPGLAILASTQSSGKTTLARRIHILLTGRDMPVATFPQGDETEIQKRLLSLLLRSPAMVCFDNVLDGTTFRSGAIAAAMTSSTIEQRVLGLSRDASCNTNTLFALTGNNLSLGPDEVSRWMVSRLAPQSSRPESRVFRHPDVTGYTLGVRHAVLRDVVGIVAGYLVSGAGIQTASRFPRWDRFVRQPILWAGSVDVAEVFARNSESAEHVMAQEGLLDSLHAVFGEEEFLASDVVDAVTGGDTFTDGIAARGFARLADAERKAMPRRIASALEALRVRNTGSSRAVGRALSAVQGRVAAIGEGDTRMEVALRERMYRGERKFRVEVRGSRAA